MQTTKLSSNIKIQVTFDTLEEMTFISDVLKSTC